MEYSCDIMSALCLEAFPFSLFISFGFSMLFLDVAHISLVPGLALLAWARHFFGSQRYIEGCFSFLQLAA